VHSLGDQATLWDLVNEGGPIMFATWNTRRRFNRAIADLSEYERSIRTLRYMSAHSSRRIGKMLRLAITAFLTAPGPTEQENARRWAEPLVAGRTVRTKTTGHTTAVAGADVALIDAVNEVEEGMES
jgi:hypothetical protein